MNYSEKNKILCLNTVEYKSPSNMLVLFYLKHYMGKK